MNVYHLFQYFFLGMQIAFVIDGNYPVSLVCFAASLAFGVVNIIQHWPNIAPDAK